MHQTLASHQVELQELDVIWLLFVKLLELHERVEKRDMPLAEDEVGVGIFHCIVCFLQPLHHSVYDAGLVERRVARVLSLRKVRAPRLLPATRLNRELVLRVRQLLARAL